MEEIEEIMEDECAPDLDYKARRIYEELNGNYLFSCTAIRAELTPGVDVVTVGYVSQNSHTMSVYPNILNIRINNTTEAEQVADKIMDYMSHRHVNMHIGKAYNEAYDGYVFYGIDYNLARKHPELLEEVKRCLKS